MVNELHLRTAPDRTAADYPEVDLSPVGPPGRRLALRLMGIGPDSCVDERFIRQVWRVLEVRGVAGPHHHSCAQALRFVSLQVALPVLPDPNEPLIRCFERGGNFGLTCTLEIDGRGISLPDPQKLVDRTPYDISEAALDAIDEPHMAMVTVRLAALERDSDEAREG
ncbi:hypothetical protein [Catellatospora tritici]|uniref:hypothetical protein n=1 Tax=Catellatospora tritici TaxID=2851566 RepID=UPI001C2D6AE8|nr:hypothetical protein [Catellatospora tritici]MBV1852436.1 hypothetical protein [Catellatospora tritici]